MAGGSGARIEISGGAFNTRVVVDGVDISKATTRATLYLSVNDIPRLDIEMLAADTAVELGGRVTYFAHAWGISRNGTDPVRVLRELADEVEKARAEIEVAIHG